VTAARAAASAAALSRVRFRMALEKSSPMPTSSVIGIIDNAKIIATLPPRSRPNLAIVLDVTRARCTAEALQRLRNSSNATRMAMHPCAQLDAQT
jgi:hypothetical protein